MYFITEKTSETGKKFQKVLEKMKTIRKFQSDLSDELGFSKWRDGYWVSAGGFTSLLFDTEPDMAIYKRVSGSKNEYMPRLNNKTGKEIAAKLKACPVLERHELNDCIGFDGGLSMTIGCNSRNKQFFGISAEEDWNIKPPKDCKEITTTEFKKLFKIK